MHNKSDFFLKGLVALKDRCEISIYDGKTVQIVTYSDRLSSHIRLLGWLKSSNDLKKSKLFQPSDQILTPVSQIPYILSDAKSKSITFNNGKYKVVGGVNLKLHGSQLEKVESYTHIGIQRTCGKSNLIPERIKMARRTSYALIGAGLHGYIGVNPKVSVKLWNTIHTCYVKVDFWSRISSTKEKGIGGAKSISQESSEEYPKSSRTNCRFSSIHYL
ncbi:unnamed protein product [Mytilus coruscus]|uniref:Uncharacterized protein n=1 Tax=Mytilus coruscus TaxID=42192 RepID=A0A6J8ERQ0_MYTCO|nr:unnamed protein product [Mytilus coruscus]